MELGDLVDGSESGRSVPSDSRIWRRELRGSLLRSRAEIAPALHVAWSRRILERLIGTFPHIEKRMVGVYWPMRGEIDLAPIIERIRRAGGVVALPAVASKNEPLAFYLWEAGAVLGSDACGLPCPLQGAAVVPDVLLVPLVGFDDKCFRLGYGGGYYDRSLAVLAPSPLTIGIGFEMGRVPTIYPQPYDIPMDFTVSEESVRAKSS